MWFLQIILMCPRIKETGGITSRVADQLSGQQPEKNLLQQFCYPGFHTPGEHPWQLVIFDSLDVTAEKLIKPEIGYAFEILLRPSSWIGHKIHMELFQAGIMAGWKLEAQ